MEITISEKQELPLLKRSEARVRIFYQGTTPTRAQLIPALADKLGVKKDLLIIDTIDAQYGDTVAYVTCRCYTDKATLEKLERKNLQEKHVIAAPPKAEEAAEPEAEEAEETPEEN